MALGQHNLNQYTSVSIAFFRKALEMDYRSAPHVWEVKNVGDALHIYSVVEKQHRASAAFKNHEELLRNGAQLAFSIQYLHDDYAVINRFIYSYNKIFDSGYEVQTAEELKLLLKDISESLALKPADRILLNNFLKCAGKFITPETQKTTASPKLFVPNQTQLLFDNIYDIAKDANRNPHQVAWLATHGFNPDLKLNGTTPVTKLACEGQHHAVELLISSGSLPKNAAQGYAAAGFFLSPESLQCVLKAIENVEIRKSIANAAKEYVTYSVDSLLDTASFDSNKSASYSQ